MRSRSKLLTLLCIGSAFSGSSWIIMLLSVIFFSLRGQVPSALFPGLVLEYLQAGYLFIATLVLLALLSLIGIGMMWQLKKTGLYLYAFTKILIYFLPVVFIGYQQLTFPGLMLTSIMIVLFGAIFSGKVPE